MHIYIYIHVYVCVYVYIYVGSTIQKRYIKVLETIQRVTKLVKWLEGKSCEDRMRTLELPSLHKWLRGDLIALYNFLRMEINKEVPICSPW